MTPQLERAALALWRARESQFFPVFVRRMTPDAIDMQSGAWAMCVEQARATIQALAWVDGTDEDLIIGASNAERVEAVSLCLAWDHMITAITAK